MEDGDDEAHSGRGGIKRESSALYTTDAEVIDAQEVKHLHYDFIAPTRYIIVSITLFQNNFRMVVHYNNGNFADVINMRDPSNAPLSHISH